MVRKCYQLRCGLCKRGINVLAERLKRDSEEAAGEYFVNVKGWRVSPDRCPDHRLVKDG